MLIRFILLPYASALFSIDDRYDCWSKVQLNLQTNIDYVDR